MIFAVLSPRTTQCPLPSSNWIVTCDTRKGTQTFAVQSCLPEQNLNAIADEAWFVEQRGQFLPQESVQENTSTWQFRAIELHVSSLTFVWVFATFLTAVCRTSFLVHKPLDLEELPMINSAVLVCQCKGCAPASKEDPRYKSVQLCLNWGTCNYKISKMFKVCTRETFRVCVFSLSGLVTLGVQHVNNQFCSTFCSAELNFESFGAVFSTHSHTHSLSHRLVTLQRER